MAPEPTGERPPTSLEPSDPERRAREAGVRAGRALAPAERTLQLAAERIAHLGGPLARAGGRPPSPRVTVVSGRAA